MKRICVTLTFTAVVFLCSNCFSQSKGVIFGTVTDGGLNEPLPFVNVGIPQIGIGAVSDLDGKYRLPNVPPGTHTLQFSYLGYAPKTREVTVVAGQGLEVDVTLAGEGVLMEEVVVKGQATGQRAAINQQINSNTIVNVISKEKLQELPDQNAAEAVGRLAGVSVYRDAGEGQRVTIRGISPRFNNITINGERLPSTQEQDRSVDLSMISPDMLEGIELYKAIRPDMDGDAVGGAVNFTVRKADEGLRTTARILGTYNDLREDYENYRTSLSISNRFLNNKLGLIATGNYQRVNRGNEFIDFAYERLGFDPETEKPILTLGDLNLGDKLEDRIRYGGSLTLDYDISENHTLLFSSNLGFTDRDRLRYRRRFRKSNNYQEFDVRQTLSNTRLWSNSLSGEHHFGQFDITWRGSVSTSDQKTPRNFSMRFREDSALTGTVNNTNDPEEFVTFFKNDVTQTIMRDSRWQTSFVEEDHKTLQLDLRYNLNIGKKINGYLKVGGKYKQVVRGRDKTEDFLRPYLQGDNPATDFPELFVTSNSGNNPPIILANFLGTYTNDGFFDGAYDILPGTPEIRKNTQSSVEGVDIGAYNALFGTDYQLGDLLPYAGHLDILKALAFYDRFQGDYLRNFEAELEEYDGEENIYAAYLMTELNFGKRLMLTGGIRMEDTRQNYSSRTGTPLEEGDGGTGFIDLIDVSASQGYTDWLPMVQARYKFGDFMDIRAAVTKTLARPNFFNLVPWERVNSAEQIIDRGKPDLDHTTAWNYDLFLSIYNKFGLLTIGAFYKELDNIDFIATRTIVGDPVFQGYEVNEPINAQDVSTVKGIEIDLQANLNNLSSRFLNGFIFGANLTLAESETFYPLFEVETEFIPVAPFFLTTVIDTFRSGKMVGQADIIANAMIGYEKRGFSARLSMTYQGDALSPGDAGVGRANSGVGRLPEQDFFDKNILRLDFALKQKLDKKGRFTLLFNLNNLTNQEEAAFLGIANQLVEEEEVFGLTGDIGFMWKFAKK